MGFLTLTIALSGLSIAISLYTVSLRLAAVADAIRSNGGR